MTTYLGTAREATSERIQNAIVTMKALLEKTEQPEEHARLTDKLDGLETILAAQWERFWNIKTGWDVLTLAAMVGTGADPKHHEAVTSFRATSWSTSTPSTMRSSGPQKSLLSLLLSCRNSPDLRRSAADCSVKAA